MRRAIAALLAAWLFLPAVPAAQAAEACPRIVSQSPYITHTLNWLGLTDCIVGVSRYDELDRPHTGGVMDPDGDAIATLHPDLLFTSDWTDADVLELATPAGARAFRLHGFQHVQPLNLTKPHSACLSAFTARRWRAAVAALQQEPATPSVGADRQARREPRGSPSAALRPLDVG